MKPRYFGPNNDEIIEDLEPKKWYEISSTKMEEWEERVLQVPIFPGKKIVVDLKYDGEIEFDSKESIFPETFRPGNVLFNPISVTQRSPIYRFEADYAFDDFFSRLSEEFLSLEEIAKMTPKGLKELLQIDERYIGRKTSGNLRIML
ncbi:hypothetical protein HYV89_02390 [Candidatus Woesearchaeota archaeon]|nr:hypothetical protein [Candidatus Woesearchaeota archaeon]